MDEENKNPEPVLSEQRIIFNCNGCGNTVVFEQGNTSGSCIKCGLQFEKHKSREAAESHLVRQPSTKPKGIIELGKDQVIFSYYFVPTKRYVVNDLTELLDVEVIRMIQGGLVDRFDQPSAIFIKSPETGEVKRITTNNPIRGYNNFCLKIWQLGGEKKCVQTTINEVNEIFAEKSPQSRYSVSECWLGLTGFFIPLVLFKKTIAVLSIGQIRLNEEKAELDLIKNIEDHTKELNIPAEELLKLVLDTNIVRAMSPQEADEFLNKCEKAGEEILRLAEKTYITERKLREQQFIDELTALFDVVSDYDSFRSIGEKITERIVNFLGMKFGVLLLNEHSEPNALKVFGKSEGIQKMDSDNMSFLLTPEDHKVLNIRKPFFCDEKNDPSICTKVYQAFSSEIGLLCWLLPCMLGHKKMAIFCLFAPSSEQFEDFEGRISGLDVEFLERLLHELEIQLGKNLAILDLEQSLRGREEFIVLTTHALKSQMHRILGKTDFLRTTCVDLAGHTQIETIVKEIDEEVKRMNYRTNTLLHFISAEDKQQYRFRFDKKSSLYELVKDVVNQYLYAAQARGITLNIATVGYLPSTYFDRPTMEIAISNIIDNAVKYSQSNRSIYIDISHDGRHQLTNIQISDFGIGIPEDELERIFDPYFRGKWHDPRRFIHGTGIGLAVAKEIITAHGGKISCQSVRGKSDRTEDELLEGHKVTFFIEIPDQPKESK